MLQIKSCYAGYSNKIILKNINLEIKKGKIIAVIGPNGCGKSTLLKTIIGLTECYQGEIRLDQKNLKMEKRIDVAKKIAYLPQNKNIQDLTVEQMVLNGRFPHLNYPHRYQATDYEYVNQAINRVALDTDRHRQLSELSGGIQQNVYVAMALAQNTSWIMMDEPTTHLDINHQFKLFDLIEMLKKEGKTVIIVLHDLAQALKYCDEIILMNQGEIVIHEEKQIVFESGKIQKVFNVKIDKINQDGKEEFLLSRKEG